MQLKCSMETDTWLGEAPALIRMNMYVFMSYTASRKGLVIKLVIDYM